MKETKTVLIKICGITKPEEADYLNECEVDYAGFVFYVKSRRNIDFKTAETIMQRLDRNIKKVAVTVSPDVRLAEDIMRHGFDILQVHKELSEEVLDSIEIPVWYAFNMEDGNDMSDRLSLLTDKSYAKKVGGILLDAPVFGSGRPFDWHKSRRLLKAGDRSSPFSGRKFILAGGLNSTNVREGISIFEPDIVDVSSGVEGTDGKSKEKIRDFVDAVRWQNDNDRTNI